jgi:predicted nucleotidyltransferase
MTPNQRGVKMVDESIIEVVRRYLDVLKKNGINVQKAILFGSYARGEARKYSDIDILVLSEEFDRDRWANEDTL